MSSQILKFIAEEFKIRKLKNKNYSLRAFAKRIGINPSQLSRLLSQKAKLTFTLANKILTALEVPENKKNTLLLELGTNQNQGKYNLKDENYVFVTPQEYQEVLKWYGFSILSYLELPNVRHSIKGISQFFGLSETVVQNVIEVFIKTKDIIEKNNTLVLNQYNHSIQSEGNPQQAKLLEKHHIDFLELSTKALYHAANESDMTGAIFAADSSKLPEAKRRIIEFRRSMSDWLNEGNLDTVYRLSIELFPTRNYPDIPTDILKSEETS